jgi:CRISPR/Cas system-associated exonuclease Cas4 (RecB family)
LEEEPFLSWFGSEWKVLNERDILRGDEKRHRPDRVMIKGGELVVVDYKTGSKSDKDFTQVRGYLSDFTKMGFVLPKGYLWYISNNEVVEVLSS